MIASVLAACGFRNTSRQAAVAQSARTRLASEVPWGVATVTEPAVYLSEGGSRQLANAVVIDVRFGSEGEADAFIAALLASFGGGNNGPTTGSELLRHVCGHDTQEPCQPWTLVQAW